MIQLVLEVLPGRRGRSGTRGPDGSEPAAAEEGIDLYHIDARFSDGIADIGRFQFRKFFLVFSYVLHAWWLRFRHGADCFYFMPANAARVPVYRDWIILGLCRPFFRRTIYHWQAAGLGAWLEEKAKPWERWVSHLLYDRPDLSVILRASNRRDADTVRSRRTVVVPNAIEDPCPNFAAEQQPRLEARSRIRQAMLAGQPVDPVWTRPGGKDAGTYKILYIGLCYREKGLFDAIEGVRLAGKKLVRPESSPAPAVPGAPDAVPGQTPPLRLQLTIAGNFWSKEDERAFHDLLLHPDFASDGPSRVVYVGYAGGAKKWHLFGDSDCLIFPTYYSAESFGIVLVEAMAFGLSVIASRWRGLHDLLPEGCPGAVDPRQPEQIAEAILSGVSRAYDPGLRAHFLSHYTADVFARKMTEALVETSRPPVS